MANKVHSTVGGWIRSRTVGTTYASNVRPIMACIDAAAMKALGQGPARKSRLLRFILPRCDGEMPSLYR